MRDFAFGSVVVLMVAGCSSSTKPAEPGPGGTTNSNPQATQKLCISNVPATCPASPPTYKADIAPLITAACNGGHCHGGNADPWPLTAHTDVFAWRQTILSDLEYCGMPPQDAGSTFSDADRLLFVTWLVCGAKND